MGRLPCHMLLATTHASHLVALTHIIDLLKQLDAVPVIDARVAKLMSDNCMSDKCAESSPASADLENSRLVGKQPSFFSEKEDDASTAATELVARLVAEQILNGNANNNAATTSTNTNTNKNTNTEDGEEEMEMSELTKQVTRAIPSLTPAMRTQTNHSAAVLDLGARDAKRAQQLLQELLVRAMDERLLHAMRAYALAWKAGMPHLRSRARDEMLVEVNWPWIGPLEDGADALRSLPERALREFTDCARKRTQHVHADEVRLLHCWLTWASGDDGDARVQVVAQMLDDDIDGFDVASGAWSYAELETLDAHTVVANSEECSRVIARAILGHFLI